MTTLHLTNCWHSESGGIATFYQALLRQAETEQRSIRLVIPGAEDGVEAHGAMHGSTGSAAGLRPSARAIA